MCPYFTILKSPDNIPEIQEEDFCSLPSPHSKTKQKQNIFAGAPVSEHSHLLCHQTQHCLQVFTSDPCWLWKNVCNLCLQSAPALFRSYDGKFHSGKVEPPMLSNLLYVSAS